MKIRYFSDLHLEFITEIDQFIKNIPHGPDEICICAGDIGNPYESNYNTFMKFISLNFKKSFVISGNHEYYNKEKSMNETNDFLTTYFKQYNNISFLDNSYEIYNNYCFIGSTLWSKITNPNYEINDVHKIPNFDYNIYNNLNTKCVDFLEQTLQNNVNCIVITHHVPSYSLIDAKYKGSTYNEWFCCDLDDLIKAHSPKIKCWIYGHTHTPSSIKINNVPFLCNPIGYPHENSNVNFQATVLLE